MKQILGILLIAVVLLLAAPSWATVTINNFTGGGTAVANQVTRFDVSGNAIDAHEHSILQVGSTFYLYGTAFSCGYGWRTMGPWCGFKVYSSSDMINWTYLGQPFDPNSGSWQANCDTGGGFSLAPIGRLCLPAAVHSR